jgi:hypothetical protein
MKKGLTELRCLLENEVPAVAPEAPTQFLGVWPVRPNEATT